jgi:membrane protein
MMLKITAKGKIMVIFCKQLFIRFKKDRCSQLAAALSFSSLLALAPLLAIAFSLLSVFAPLEAMGQNLENFIYQYLVPDAGLDIRQYLTDFTKQAGKLTAIGLFSFLLTAVFLLNNIENSLNIIWKSTVRRGLVQRFLIYWALLTFGPILMGAGLSLSTYALSLNALNKLDELVSIKLILLKILPIIFEIAAFTLLYIIMPNIEIKWRNALIGGIVAAILFEITKRLFALFIINFNNYEVIYGTLATLPIFLIWIYLSWLVTLLGAEIIAVLESNDAKNSVTAIEQTPDDKTAIID